MGTFCCLLPYTTWIPGFEISVHPQNVSKEARINPRQIWSSSRIGMNFKVDG